VNKATDYKGIAQGITPSQVAALLTDLVKTPSVSKEERGLAEKLMVLCERMGLTSRIDRHGNMIASKNYRKTGTKLALNSHMDTVDVGESWTKNPFGAEIIGNRLYGLGSCDCKGSIAAMLLAMDAVIHSGAELAGELCFTAVVQEEVQGETNKGTVKLLNDGFRADLALVGEPTELTICRGCEGMVEVEVTTTGIPVHASNAEQGVNAILNMAKVIGGVSKFTAVQDNCFSRRPPL
jgi:acetylornithine deacetylase/succinyl-diaminopimelate desuccinylase-like protein